MIPINTDLLQKIHDYLMTKPMREVESLIVEIRNLQPAEPNVVPTEIDSVRK